MEKRGLDDGAGPSDHNKRQKIPALGRFGSNFEDCFYSFFFVCGWKFRTLCCLRMGENLVTRLGIFICAFYFYSTMFQLYLGF